MSSTRSKTPERTMHWCRLCVLIDKEFNVSMIDPAARQMLREFCIDQKARADAEGYDDTAQYIQHVLDDLGDK